MRLLQSIALFFMCKIYWFDTELYTTVFIQTTLLDFLDSRMLRSSIILYIFGISIKNGLNWGIFQWNVEYFRLVFDFGRFLDHTKCNF